MTVEEQSYQASHDFYMWECLHRGYYLFDYPIDLAIPYRPFERREPIGYIDDGKVPSFFKRLGNTLKPSIPTERDEKPLYDFPVPLEITDDLRVLVLTFKERVAIDRLLSVELLSMFSLSKDPLSFEIIGTGSDIRIQLTCSEYDHPRVVSHIKAYFPTVHITEGEQFEMIFDASDDGSEIALVDFGLEYEFMLPIAQGRDFKIDPLTSVIAQFESLRTGSVVIFQILFKGISTPLSNDIMFAMSDGEGGAFFESNPEMMEGAKQKVSSPLFACVMRVAAQGTSKSHSEYLAKELISSLCFGSDSGENNLVAVSNEGYEYNQHVMNVFHRQSNRLGMILNAEELVNYVHYPNNTIVSEKLGGGELGKEAPLHVQNQKYHLGINQVGNTEIEVSLSDEQRLSHTHVIGVTGMGKSTLLANMFVQDIELGGGGVMFDPHGDIIDDILLRIPEHRQNDVIILDPSDSEFPIGFNLLHAETEAERLVLSSDLVSAFRKYATSWGDRIESVLSNAIDTFLESDKGGTLIELKRFLLEKKFRDQFLKTVHDPQLQYYWKHDFALVTRASLSPLLIRIDTFLRPKIIRHMFAQKSGLDLADIVNGNKILLVKLSQGLIGKGNAHLLGTLLVSKLGQVALGRQSLSKSERTPFYVYMDEFQNLMTDSISEMLSGVRKYGVGLVLAHQDMEQLSRDTELAQSILSNPNIRICFRLGDTDAKLMERRFSGFDMNDLQSLPRGKAIMRVGGMQNDFNIAFPRLIDEANGGSEIRCSIIERTRLHYTKPRVLVEQILSDLLPSFEKEEKVTPPKKEKIKEVVLPDEPTRDHTEVVPEPVPPVSDESFDKEAMHLKETAKKERKEREHEKLKVKIGSFAQSQGFRIVYEEETTSGRRVDVALHNSEVKIACEISVTNTAEYEVQNIKKCIEAKYDVVCMTSPSPEHLSAIQERAEKELSKAELKKVVFCLPIDISGFIKSHKIVPKPKEKIIKGYRVKVKYSDTDAHSIEEAQKTIAKTVLDSLKRKKPL